MTDINAELKRKDGAGNLVNWTLVPDTTSPTTLSDPVIDQGLRDRIGDVSATPTANTVLARLKTIADTLTTINGNVDGLEGFVDGLETLITTLNGYVDGLEGHVDGIETLLTNLNGFVDGLEGQLTTLNSKEFATQTTLAAVLAAVDGLEGQLTALQTELNQKTEPADQQHVVIDSGTTVVTDGGGSITVDGQALEVTGTAAALNADLIASTNVASYRWVTLHVTGIYVGTWTFQASNDNSNWVNVPLWDAAATIVGSSASGSNTTAALFHGPVVGKYFRVRMTAYTSGTASATALFTAMPNRPAHSGSVEVTELPGAVALSDALSNPTTSQIGSNLLLWDTAASQWERAISDGSGRAVVVATGDVAADAVDSGNPVKIGGPARPIGTPPTQVATNDRVAAWFDLRGRLVVATDAADNFLTNANIQVGDVDVSNANPVPVSDAGGSLTVDGTVDLGATTLSALESITVQNGAGAAAVNIQDGGNSITVDAVDLDIRNLNSAQDTVAVALEPVIVSGSAAALNADAIAQTEVKGRWVTVQITGTWAGTLTHQGSNDGTNWVTLATFHSTTSTANAVGSTTTANVVHHGHVPTRYYRFRMTSYTSGTAVGTALISSLPGAYQTMAVDVTELPASGALSDTLSNPTTTLIGSSLLLWDAVGSVWERWQSNTAGRALVDANISDNGGSITVDAVSWPLPTGAATATNQDPLVKYKIADTDEPLSGAKYYGFTMTTGTWVIMRETTSGNTKLYRYANLGNNGTINGGAAVSYGNATTTNEPWTNRATLTYDYLHNLTGI